MKITINANEHVIDALHRNGISYSSGWVQMNDKSVAPASEELVIEIAEDDKCGGGGYKQRIVQVIEMQ